MADRRVVPAALMVLALAGCSSEPSVKASSASTPTSPPASSASQRPGTPAGPSLSPSSDPRPGAATPAAGGTTGPTAGPSAGGSPSATPSYTRDMLKISVKPCVQPGQKQELSFRTRPNMQVVVNTRYADNKDGQAHGGYDYGRRTDAQGNYRLVWVVDPATPTGTARSLVGAVDGSGTANGWADWRVALRC